jgi:hypothetical protein
LKNKFRIVKKLEAMGFASLFSGETELGIFFKCNEIHGMELPVFRLTLFHLPHLQSIPR